MASARQRRKAPKQRHPETVALLRVKLNPEDVAAPHGGGEFGPVARRRDDVGGIVAHRAIAVDVIEALLAFIAGDERIRAGSP